MITVLKQVGKICFLSKKKLIRKTGAYVFLKNAPLKY
jgi:hypothetical protein